MSWINLDFILSISQPIQLLTREKKYYVTSYQSAVKHFFEYSGFLWICENRSFNLQKNDPHTEWAETLKGPSAQHWLCLPQQWGPWYESPTTWENAHSHSHMHTHRCGHAKSTLFLQGFGIKESPVGERWIY